MNDNHNSRSGAVRRGLSIAALALACLLSADAQALTVPTPSCSQGAFATYVRVKFSAVTGAVRYYVKRGTTSDFEEASWIGYVTENYVIDSTVKPGAKYYYWICPSEDETLENSYYSESRYARGYAKKPTLPKPDASDGKYTGYIRIRWAKVDGATAYGVWESPTTDYDDGSIFGVVEATTSSKMDVKLTGTTPGKKAYYWIGASINGYDFWKTSKSYCDVGWRRQVLQIATPVYNVIDNASYWILAENGVSVAAKKLSTTYSVSKCATVEKYSEPDEDGLSGSITGKKEGTVTLKATYNGLTVTSKPVQILKSSWNTVSAYGD